MKSQRVRVLALLVTCATACGRSTEPPAGFIHARFDPDAEVIPMPSDVLRDATGGHLDLPLDDVTPAEAELYGWMNGLDGWSSAQVASVELTGAIDPATLTADTLQVWEWGDVPTPVADVRIEIVADGTELRIAPPRTGWKRGGRYAILLVGGEAGARGAAGELVECDAAFYFLRLTQRLDDPAHVRAFPGDTVAERADNAAKLEEIRVELSPYFDFFEGRGRPRADVAALWTFSVTRKIELAMDEASQRMPLPIDLLIDPATGKVHLPDAPWDSDTIRDAKHDLATLDGFAVSGGRTFGFTAPIDPATATEDTIELWRTDPTTGALAEQVPVDVGFLEDGLHVELRPRGGPLRERTRYAVIVREGLVGADGSEVVLMPAGRLLLAEAHVELGGLSEVGPVDDDDAVKVERVRAAVAPALADARTRGAPVFAAWTFTTMSVQAPMDAWLAKPAELQVAVDPVIAERMSTLEAILDFPLAIGSIGNVAQVIHGTIQTPVFLDPATRAFRPDGRAELEDVAFTLAVPRNVSGPVPVVIFGHAIMTERRMVLAIANALAAKGFAAVSIDLPMHGTRAHCWTEGPLSIPNPTTGQLTPLTQACVAGASCSADGRCVDASGATRPFQSWPIIPMPMVSGAAFLEIEHIANTRDHFIQAEIDLTSLLRSLQEGDWSGAIGAPVDPSRIYYAGQSLGGILGGTFVANHPDVKTAVLNVPGANTVDMFQESPFFGPQVDAFFDREAVAPDSYDGHRFMNVAHWFMDAADPQSFAPRLLEGREVLLQMATLDVIIPNAYTRTLETLSGATRRDYVAEHGFLVIPLEPEYLRGVRELADFLDGWRP